MKRENSVADNEGPVKKMHKADESIRLLIPSKVKSSPESAKIDLIILICNLLYPPAFSSFPCRLLELLLEREGRTFKSCALRYETNDITTPFAY